MGSRLDRINDWPERARAAGYSVQTLAQTFGVSPRTVARRIKTQFGKTPKRWLLQMRKQQMLQAVRREFASRMWRRNWATTICQISPATSKNYLAAAPVILPTPFCLSRKLINKSPRVGRCECLISLAVAIVSLVRELRK